jgi:hypothetical protein
MEILSMVTFYFIVAFCVLIVNAMIAGYHGGSAGIDDAVQSFFWPVSIASLLGLLLKIGVDAYKEQQEKPTATAKQKKETK